VSAQTRSFLHASASPGGIELGKPKAIIVLKIAYTPDSDDAYTYYAWQRGQVGIEGHSAEFSRAPINELNEAANREEFDVVAVSSIRYPSLADKYCILTCGTSVGRGWGPVLVAAKPLNISDLAGKVIATGGVPTTGSTLASFYCQDCQLVVLPYEEIGDAVKSGRVDAGVMIHEELLHYRTLGLHKVLDLGAAWCEETGQPLPVGLNIARRALGDKLLGQIASACQRSLSWAQANQAEAFEHARQFGRGLAEEHISMFSNEDTLALQEDVRRGMRLLFDRVAEHGIGPAVDRIDIIEGELSPAR
jgi:1,4-dihydroxy-6-naphthoate synthase